MINNLIYIFATSSLLIGSTLQFDKNDLSSYFFVGGSSLFVVKSLIDLIKYTKLCEPKKSYY